MRKKSTEEIISSQKQKITIDFLYLRNKNKEITKGFIEFLLNQKQTKVLELLNKAKSKEEFHNLIKENYQQLQNKQGSIFECLLTGKAYGTYEESLNMISLNEAQMFLNGEYSKKDLKKILEINSQILTSYISKHNKLKHKFLPTEYINNNPIVDFRTPFTEDNFKEICNLLFRQTTKDDHFYKNDISSFIFRLLSLYDKNTLINNKEFVEFELEYGYFDKYCELLDRREAVPTLDERMKIFNAEKDITSTQHYYLDNIDLLEKRISSLKIQSKDLVLAKIKLIRQEQDIKKKASLLEECFEYYEKSYRKEIVDSLYSPTSSTEITDFREVDNVMIHVFLRDAKAKLPTYRESLKQEILSKRGTKVTGTEELTEEEKKIYDEKMDYAINILLNPVLTSESLDTVSVYSDSTSFRWYKSNTANQISTSVLGIDALLRQPNCVGVGFDNSSISPENIIISSNVYQTTNMGVDNLEVNPQEHFLNFSAPLSELIQKNRTEVVMYRKQGDIKTEAAYVFAIINGRNEEKDKQTIMEAKEYAEKNHIKLIVFNNYKIKKSYDEYLQNEQNVEEIENIKAM